MKMVSSSIFKFPPSRSRGYFILDNDESSDRWILANRSLHRSLPILLRSRNCLRLPATLVYLYKHLLESWFEIDNHPSCKYRDYLA